ncbi:hypothetical protein WOLCODRAFT_162110 [Wolfiporia cocos MD-104 SS10]|uniref:Uncharacterized protein n=1 Tax=Wolfiporia cocos (strain MD-104) TaxID=742152 RepID=A0A2H3JQT3_WOLCO|nr:hypothetical protein WOLCODRAFT_162110 [Wolfiporia cocos MD-104 SS10]
MVNSMVGRSPITIMPDEILPIILGFSLEPGAYNTSRIFRLIELSHVSRRWRVVLLDTPGMWSLVDLRYPTIGQVFCARCQTSPIRITYVQSESGYTARRVPTLAALEWLEPYVAQVEGIHVAASQTIMKNIMSLFGCAFPELHGLISGLDSGATIGPSMVVEFHAGRVCRTSADGISVVSFGEPRSIPQGLTRLALTRLRTRLSVAAVVAALERCPGLEELRVASAILQNLGPRAELEDHPIVRLPRLRFLEVGDSSPEVISSFLAHLSIPPTASISIHALTTQTLSAILPSDISELRSLTAVSYNGETITRALDISATALRIHNRTFHHLSSASFSLKPNRMPQILMNSLDVGSIFAHITSLRAISTNIGIFHPVIPEASWKALLSCLPLLTALEIGGPWAEHLLCALSRPISATSNLTPVQQDSLPCARLRCLRILVMSPDGPQTERLMVVLERYLSTRAELTGSLLESLHIGMHSGPARTAVSSMMEHLQRVTKEVYIHETY